VEKILHAKVERLTVKHNALTAHLLENPAVWLGGEVGDLLVLSIERARRAARWSGCVYWFFLFARRNCEGECRNGA
jgi:hypothetical protein